MPNLPENGEPTPGTVEAVVTRNAVEKAVTSGEQVALGPKSASLAAIATTTVYGFEAGSKMGPTATGNTAFGTAALQKVQSTTANTAVGSAALRGTEGEKNTAVGKEALVSLSGVASNNVALGAGAGGGCISGESNVFIGTNAGVAETGSGKLYIANNGTTALVQGVMSEMAASQELGLYGVAPVKRAAHPTTLAEVITILKNIGICE